MVIHTFPEQTARLAKDSHIGHSAIVHGSKIGENVLVGMGAILHEGVEIGENCVIGSGCIITDNQKIPAGKLVVGVPGKIIGDVSPEMHRSKVVGTKLYQTLPRRYRETAQIDWVIPRPKMLKDKTESGQQYQVGHPFLPESMG